MFFDLLTLIIGLIVLSAGAEFFVRGATNIALRYGVSPLIVGLTIVAFGTSAPELFVSLFAAFEGNADIAVGNVIGSNIFNILVIVGFASIVSSVTIERSISKREAPLMCLVMLAFVLVALSENISRLEGVLLSIGIFAYLFYNYKMAKKGAGSIVVEHELQVEDGYNDQPAMNKHALIKDCLLLIAGLAGLILGSDTIVESATSIASVLGVPDLVIGITLVAAGTSLPELATTVVAAMKGHPELALGNAIGSNVFNVLCVIGFTSTVSPLSVNPSALEFDIWFMLFSACLVGVLMILRDKFKRKEGAILLGLYGLYIGYLALRMVKAN